ncbi:MAG: BolA family protein [Alphaproteobacteria bacterium]|jgi:BolA protein
MSVMATIEEKLKAALNPLRLEVEDQSHLHAGHAGAREGGESHFAVVIVAEIFQDMSRLARQRLVNEALAQELAGPIHALSIRAMTDDEDKREI